MRSKTLFIFVVLSILASSGYSTLIDFETVPPGQNPQVKNTYIGDTYDSLGVDLWSKNSIFPRWNYNVYNNSGWFVNGGSTSSTGNRDHIGLTFATGVSEVSMTLFTRSGVQFWAYDTNNEYIPGVTSIYPNGGWKTKTITAPTGKLISRIEFQCTTYNTVMSMDNLSFIPEPTTMCMLGFGALIVFKRREP